MRIGNDVVDLTAPRTRGRSDDQRFMERVLTDSEAAEVRAAGRPDLELWYHWAAKETAYKVVSKMLEEPPAFAHRSFIVRWEEAASPGVPRTGLVRYGERIVHVDAEVGPGGAFLHVTGVSAMVSGQRRHVSVASLDEPNAAWSGTHEVLRGRLSAAELRSVHSRPAAAVRVAARAHIERALSLAPGRAEIVCDGGPLGRTPPRLLVDGSPSRVDLSLSHDGPWIAWAFLVTEGRGIDG